MSCTPVVPIKKEDSQFDGHMAVLNQFAVVTLLKEHRESINCSQLVLSKRLGVSNSYVSLLERGERKCDLNLFLLWCAAFDIEPWNVLKRAAVGGCGG